MPRPQAPPVTIARWRTGEWRDDRDQVAAEEPLQLSLDGRPLSIVMRTPGNDLELALGLLWAERVIRSLDDVVRVRISAEAQEREAAVPLGGDLVESNQVDVHVRENGSRRPERSFLATSACGVCGATTLESLADLQRVAQLDVGSRPARSWTRRSCRRSRIGFASGSASSRPPAGCTRRVSSTTVASFSSFVRTSDGTTRSTRWSAARSWTDASRCAAPSWR